MPIEDWPAGQKAFLLFISFLTGNVSRVYWIIKELFLCAHAQRKEEFFGPRSTVTAFITFSLFLKRSLR